MTAPSRKNLLQTAIMCIAAFGLVAVLFREFWTPAVFLAGADTFSHDYLMWQWGWGQYLLTGHIPLWHPYLFGGWPFVASFAFCPYYPPAWISIAFPSSLALTTQYALHFAIGAIGFYLFARAMRVSFVPALVIALLYESSSHIVTLAHPGHLAKVQSIAWLPWAMAAAHMMARERRSRWAIGIGIAWALQLLASHFQIFYATFWLVAFYLAGFWVKDLIEWRRARSSRDEISENESIESLEPLRFGSRLLLGIAIAAIFAATLSAAQMLPSIELARISNRPAGGVAFKEAASDAIPIEEMLEVAMPTFRGASIEGSTYYGRWHKDPSKPGAMGERLVSDYAGIWPVILAIIGLCFSPARKKWFFLAAAMVAGLVAIGDATPLFRLLFHTIPGFNRFRSPATFMVVLNFSLFALAVLGFERVWLHYLKNPKSLFKVKWFFISYLSFMASFIFLMSIKIDPFGLSPQSNLFLKSIADDMLSISGALFLALFINAPLIFQKNYPSFLRFRHLVLASFLVFPLLDSYAHSSRFLPRNDTAGFEAYLLGNPSDTAIKRDSAAAGEPFPTSIEVGRELNNRFVISGIRSTHGYHPVVYGAYEKLVQACGGFYSPAFQRHFAQNYNEFSEANAPPKDWHVIARGDGHTVIARNDRIPLGRLPREVKPIGAQWDDLSLEQWRQMIGQKDFNGGNLTLCEGNYSWRPADSKALANWKVETLPESSDEMRLRLAPANSEATTESLRAIAGPEGIIPCLLAIPAGDGWRVAMQTGKGSILQTWEGLSQKPEWPKRVNGFFLLVPLDPNGGEAIVSYEPKSARMGVMISELAICGVLVMLLAVIRRSSGRHGRDGLDGRNGQS